MFNLFRKQLQKKIVVAVAVPYTKNQFDTIAKRGDSDFIRSLSTLYKTDDEHLIWDRYSKTAQIVCDNLKKFERRGAVVIKELTTDHFECFSDADIVILIAHHSDTADEIEMADRMVASQDFVNAIPLQFKGVLDMSSCYSTTSQLSIKMRCPQCHILAVIDKTPLALRMQIYDYVISLISNKPKTEYLDAVKSAFSIIYQLQQSNGRKKVVPEMVYLGGGIQSSVFAPKEVERGQPFLIQLVIHKSSDSDAVEIMAKEADGSTSLRNPLRLKLKLKKGDRVDISLSIESPDKNDFKIKKTRDFFYWENEPRFTNFTVSVSEQCKSKSCIASIKICVNKLPAGTISFKSDVVEALPAKMEAADISFDNYDKRQEMLEAKMLLLHQLESELGLLEKQQDNNITDSTSFKRDIEICKNSISLLNKDHTEQKVGNTYKVFISSTSDLHEFRKVMEQRILECSMYPEMYERWPQKDKYPRDYCIEKVLSSDIFVCILGAKYGYIEPTINTSMTEIEFRVALLAGKPILIYVLNNYEEKMLDLLPEHQFEVDKQRKLINELNKKRMVEFFNDSFGLALLSSRELTILQKELDYENTNKRQN